MVLALFHFSWWTLAIAFGVCAVFAYASYKNRTLVWALRRLRSKMRSGGVVARPRFYRQRFTFDQQLSDIDFRERGKK